MLFSALKIGALAYVGLCLLVFVRQGAYVYYPSKLVEATPEAIGLRFEELTLVARDGVTLSAWWVPAAAETQARALIYFHGNAGNNGDRLDALRALHDLNVNVLIVDYRGYGRSAGRPTEQGTYLDALAAWDYLTRERGVAPNRIFILGRSLGGAVAAWLAAQTQPAGAILESTFTSAPAMAGRMFPFLPIRLLCRFRYDTLSLLPRLACPVLIAHSPRDEIIPYQHGRELFAAAREPKTFVELTLDHNAGELGLEPQYRAALTEFLNR